MNFSLSKKDAAALNEYLAHKHAEALADDRLSKTLRASELFFLLRKKASEAPSGGWESLKQFDELRDLLVELIGEFRGKS